MLRYVATVLHSVVSIAVPRASRRRSQSGLPAEAVADIISFLDRLSIERALMVGRQVTQAAGHLLTLGKVPVRFFVAAGICLRSDGSFFLLIILNEDVRAVFEDLDAWEYVIRWSIIRQTGICAFHLETPVVTSSIRDRFIRFMQMMGSVEAVQFRNVNLCSRSPGELKELTSFGFLKDIFFDRCQMLSISIDNEFLRLISEHREHDLILSMSDSVPCDRATFAVDDDGILQFLCSGEGKYERKLEIWHSNATEQLPLRLESAFAAIQGEPQVQLTLVPRHPNHQRVIEATNRFTPAVAGPRDDVVYIHDESPMLFWLIDTRLTPSLGVMLHPNNE